MRLYRSLLASLLAVCLVAQPALAEYIGATVPVNRGGTGATTLDGAGIVTKTGVQTLAGNKTFSGHTYLGLTDLSALLTGTTATFSGTVTAASFIGSGVGLTGIPGASITGTVPTGTLPVGSVAALGLLQVGAGLSVASGVVANAGVTTFNSRAGAVSLAFSDVTGALGYTPLSAASLLSAANLTGTLPNGVFPATLPAASGVNLTGITTSQVAEGSNLYYTNGRAAAAAPVQSFNGRTGAIVPGSSDYTPAQVGALALTGGTLTGNVTTAASAVGGAGLNLPHGAAPTTPANGDLWTTTTGLYGRINGATVGPYTSNTGTVTSVAMTVPGDLSVSGSPVTGAGTLAITRSSQAANLVFAAPNGSAGIPTYRALVGADMPGAVVQNVTITKPGVLYNTPVNATVSGGTATLAETLVTQTANTVLAGPTTGAAATPTMRAIVANDLPATMNATSFPGLTSTSGLTVSSGAVSLPAASVADAALSSNVPLLAATTNNFTGKLGIGATSPNGKLEVINPTLASQILFGTATDQAAMLANSGTAWYGWGSRYSGGWVARQTSAGNLAIDGSAGLLFYFNNGLTIGNTYTPTQRFSVDGSGNLTATGNITSSGATGFTGVGTALTALNGTNVTSGTVADARLPSSMATKTFTGVTTFPGLTSIDGGGALTAGGASFTQVGSPQVNIGGATNAAGYLGFKRADGATAGFVGYPASVESAEFTLRGNGGSGFLTFYAASNERARITSAGNLGLATTTPTYGLHQLGGSQRLQALATPAAPTVTPVGITGSTSYWYWVVAVDRAGFKTLVGPAGTTATANAVLDTSNYNTATWAAVTGAVSYDVLRTNSSTAPTGTQTVKLGNTTALTLNDQGASLVSYIVDPNVKTANPGS